MNKAEKSFAASEAEMLASVWAAKYFRCYLYGRKFVVKTNHAALTYLKNFRDQNAQPMRWSLKLRSKWQYIPAVSRKNKIT